MVHRSPSAERVESEHQVAPCKGGREQKCGLEARRRKVLRVDGARKVGHKQAVEIKEWIHVHKECMFLEKAKV